MSPADRAYWMIAQRRVAGLQPDVVAALFRAFAILRENLTEAQLAAALKSGSIEALIQDALNERVMERAFIPVRQRMRQTVERGFTYAIPEMPKGGKVNGQIAVAFDYLHPNVIEAVRDLDVKALSSLKDETRAVVRQAGEQALTDGVGPRVFGRRIKDAIGLAPAHETYIRNYERELREGKSGALGRALRDRRFDKSTTKAFAGEGLSEEQITARVDAYRRKWEQHNANTVARTITLQSYKEGQALSWQQARANGVVPPDARLMKTWVQIDRPTKRESHIPMHGETVAFDERYSNGDLVPGENDWNCGCLSRVTVEKAAA